MQVPKKYICSYFVMILNENQKTLISVIYLNLENQGENI